ncbi:MAG TPA: efflux RND transporter periplasmic adaptor subunit [Acidobacteriaceae bacterium]|nr:efflux RND transporter periplasmic adaptor subunit [Acidobacteriaceae bacterium]
MSMPSRPALELTNELLTAADSSVRARLIALAVVELIADSACLVHRLLEGDDGPMLLPVGMAGQVSMGEQMLSADSDLVLALLAGREEPLVFSGAEVPREEYAHVNVSRSIASLAYLPFSQTGTVVGLIEVMKFAEPISATELERLAELATLAGPAILSAEEFERQRQDLLDSVHRMTQLYDLEKSLNATLELEAVMAMVPPKTSAMLECQAMHLWLFDGDQLRLMAGHGEDATVDVGTVQTADEGYVAAMAEEGEPLLIDDAEDPRLLQRNTALEALSEEQRTERITNALVVPLMQDESEIGVLEAVNRGGGKVFDEDDQFFLSAMAETVSNALKNASLMHAERKLEILEALVHVSSEITSTLRLDRLLQIIVNSPQSVIPYELCAITLDNRGNLQLKAVSGMASIPMGDVQVDRLQDLVRWLSSESSALHVRQTEQENGEEIPEAVARYFEGTGYRALFALPLADDQGRVGMLLYAATDPDFLDTAQTEMIKILAAQATVAIRNALLYREVPLIGLLEPLMQKKREILRTSGSRKLFYGGVTAVALLFLLFCPLPMRVSGEAMVEAQHLVTIAAPTDGNVESVAVREGQRVAAGEQLGRMNDWQWKADLAAAQAKYEAAELGMEASLAGGSAKAGEDRAEVEYLRTAVARAQSRVDSAELRSPIDGFVATPALQSAAGEHLNAGDPFAKVLDLSSVVMDISVAQSDVALVRPGDRAVIKLDSYPQQTWRGVVSIVSPLAQTVNDDRTFAARVTLGNREATLRAGMSGHGKIFIGYRSAGYVLLRKPSLWVWQTLWNWIGW